MKDLVKNPIGIVALFISLIYGFANLLLGVTATALTSEERQPIIIFIVLFPVVVLGVFYLLVSRHHGKLYAPGDYKDDKSFLRTLSQEEREEKLNKEIEEALPTSEQSEKIPPSATTQGVQKPIRVNSEYRQEIQFVESMVISRFESELNQRAQRDIGIGDTGVYFDALFASEKSITCLEVKMVRSAVFGNSIIDKVLYGAVVADKYLDAKFKLIVALVYSFEKEELLRIENYWRKRIEKCPASVEVRFIARSELNT
ncbi:hypothetical protein [Stutzerimonas stutzeri]|uniref:hypothetical protein n=1 Tax=Stutzerimonas stutzeri TaxID=316 RepID=UPI00037F881E|nr:hypothetical protein [Stutzerimonas stutzeri]